MPPLSSAFISLALVIGVVDGDTIKVRYDSGETATVRLIGIDTPEMRPVECFGPQAKQAAREYMLHKRVKLQADPTQSFEDRYGRKLRYVWLGPDLINLRLVSNGFAREYTYKKPYAYQQQFIYAQQVAQSFNNGLWAECGE